MCDFSLYHAKSRPAQVEDKLEVIDFGRGTFGFAEQGKTSGPIEDMVAVCVIPGTEIAFDETPSFRWFETDGDGPITEKVARFRQINLDKPCAHHDALEFADGRVILLNRLAGGAKARVLQLPAAPKTEAEAKEQERLPVTA